MRDWESMFFIAAFLAWPFTSLPNSTSACGLPISAERSYAPPPADVELPYYEVRFRHTERAPAELIAVRHQYSSRGSARTVLVSADGHNWRVSNSHIASDHELAPVGAAPEWNPKDHNFGLKFSESQLMMSNDHGRSWVRVPGDDLLQRPVTLKGQTEALAALEARGLHSHYSIASWQKLVIFAIIFDGIERETVYLLTNQGVFKSCDRAISWILLPVGTERLFSVHSLAINPFDSTNLVIGTTNGVYISHDGGCSFEQVLKIS